MRANDGNTFQNHRLWPYTVTFVMPAEKLIEGVEVKVCVSRGLDVDERFYPVKGLIGDARKHLAVLPYSFKVLELGSERILMHLHEFKDENGLATLISDIGDFVEETRDVRGIRKQLFGF